MTCASRVLLSRAQHFQTPLAGTACRLGHRARGRSWVEHRAAHQAFVGEEPLAISLVQSAAGQRRGHVGAAAAGAQEQSERFRNASSLAGRRSTQKMGPQTALTITLASSFRTAL